MEIEGENRLRHDKLGRAIAAQTFDVSASSRRLLEPSNLEKSSKPTLL
jgi:hypothetical protein